MPAFAPVCRFPERVLSPLRGGRQSAALAAAPRLAQRENRPDASGQLRHQFSRFVFVVGPGKFRASLLDFRARCRDFLENRTNGPEVRQHLCGIGLTEVGLGRAFLTSPSRPEIPAIPAVILAAKEARECHRHGEPAGPNFAQIVAWRRHLANHLGTFQILWPPLGRTRFKLGFRIGPNSI